MNNDISYWTHKDTKVFIDVSLSIAYKHLVHYVTLMLNARSLPSDTTWVVCGSAFLY